MNGRDHILCHIPRTYKTQSKMHSFNNIIISICDCADFKINSPHDIMPNRNHANTGIYKQYPRNILDMIQKYTHTLFCICFLFYERMYLISVPESLPSYTPIFTLKRHLKIIANLKFSKIITLHSHFKGFMLWKLKYKLYNRFGV